MNVIDKRPETRFDELKVGDIFEFDGEIHMQIKAMTEYLAVLEARAVMENIQLKGWGED